MIESGDVDMMTGVLRRPRRANYAHFLVPPYRSRTNKAFYVLKGNEKAIGTYDDLRSLTIGTQIGGKYFARFDSDAAIEKVAVTDTERNIKMLIAGRIDAYVMSEEAGDYRLASFGLSDTIAKAEYRYCKEQNVFMVLSKRSPHASRLDEFNRELKALLQQHEYERIKEKVLPGIRRVP